MAVTYKETVGGLAYDGAFHYLTRKDDAFFLFLSNASYAAAVQFEVWVAPMDKAQPAGICIPDLTKERKVQFAPQSCPGFAASPSGDLLAKLSAPTGTLAAGESRLVASGCVKMRIPLCDLDDFITVKPVGAAANVTAVLITSGFTR